MIVTSTGTNGGGRGANGANGAKQKLALVLAAGFVAILVAITIGNAGSTISDFAAAGVPETRAHVWIWEITSVLAWLSVTPLIWLAVERVRMARFGWPAVALIALAGMPLASAWHIGVMIGLRHVVYAGLSERYHFEGGLANPLLYEFRKDVATYLQFTGLAALAQWLLARTDPVTSPVQMSIEKPRTIVVADGATRHLVPIAKIEHVSAAGNYVEVAAEGRILLHRATLAAIGSELGPGFVRIHRSHLVNREAIRRTETDRSGDFAVELTSGRVLRGSRRYRTNI